MVQFPESRIGHRPDWTQGVIFRHPQLRADRAEQGILLNIGSAHRVDCRPWRIAAIFAVRQGISTACLERGGRYHAVRVGRGAGRAGLDSGRVSCHQSADDKFAA